MLPLSWAIAVAVALILTPLVCWWSIATKPGWLMLFFVAILLLPPLPLPVGDTGPHPSILVAGLGLLLGIARLPEWSGRQASRLTWRAVDLAILALLLALTISIGYAAIYSGLSIATASAARVMLFGIGVYVYFAAAHGPDRQSTASSLRTTRWLFCIDFLFHLPAPAAFEPQFIWLDSGVYRRAQGLFYESSTLGNFCACFLVFIGVSFATPSARRIVSSTTLCVGAILFASALLLSFSRSSVLAVIIAYVVLAFVERRRWYKRREVLVMGGLAVLAVIGFAVAVPEVAGGYWGRLNIAFDNITEAPDRALSGRLESWSTIAGFISTHLLQTVFGIGYKTLPYTEYLGRPVIADNMYLSLLVETGVPGLIALCALNITILVASWRAMRRGSFHGKWLFCFWVAEAFQMMTGDILTYWRVLPVYFWILACTVRDAYSQGAISES
jgi:O-antigen ligase